MKCRVSETMHKNMNLICKLTGHVLTDVDTERFTAKCKRCGAGLKVSYDMAKGETIILGEIGDA